MQEVESMVAYRLRERVAALLASEGRSVADDLAARRIDPYAASATVVQALEVSRPD